AEYQGAAEVKIKEKPHKEVYKVIPKSDIEGDGVIVKFMCERTGLPATFLDDHTARLGPFRVSIEGDIAGGTIPLELWPNQDEPN
ncbi:MAG: hypothetical protein AB1665_02385, partial [Candidatus Thermoplasmatota archaeon]